jgi:hypothetical protein
MKKMKKMKKKFGDFDTSWRKKCFPSPPGGNKYLGKRGRNRGGANVAYGQGGHLESH